MSAAGLAVGLSLLAAGSYAGWLVANDNFHAVVADEFYRSAQPSPARLALYAGRYGIRTVVNLRGANPGRDWYDAEVGTAGALGLTLVDFRIKASRGLSLGEVDDLVRLFARAEKPILVHCNSGVDRAGLAAALYLAGVKGESVAVAERQLSLRFGHLAWPLLSGYAMDETFKASHPAPRTSGS